VRAFLAWRELVKSAMDDGYIRPMDLTMATLLSWLPLHGLVASRISLPTFPWPSREQVVETLIDATLAGLVKG
jgi:hypothetical protein